MGRKPKDPAPPDTARGALSPEDRQLWGHVTRQAEPLAGRDRLRSKTDDLREGAGRATTAAAPRGRPAQRRAAQPPGQAPAQSPPQSPAAAGRQPPPLVHGARDGLDRRKAERLRRGKLPIEATLDLHGLRQAEAHRRLELFLADCQAAGKRCVLVVTGKGATRAEAGVLRSALPHWLNQPPNRARVLSFDYAQQKHGGTGAVYILLRRKR
ncbi:Smr/MutS family protein [Pelagibius sp.]|uniref:Smr/MutS family protein n=1 Tax=Pelagibius sp. TaxID=1931238 RepID=UPI003B502575